MSKLKGKILVIDDDKDVLYTANLVLKQKFDSVQIETDPNRIVRLIESFQPDVIFLDMNFAHGAISGNEGLYWLREIMKVDNQAHVVMNTAYGDVQVAVEAMKLGAIDFLEKPWESEKLLSTAINIYNLKKSKKEVSELKNKQEQLNKEFGFQTSELIYQSSEMSQVLSTVEKVAKTNASVLILGENGTGKEIIARELHRQSSRSNEPFIKVDLGAIPMTLFESELFGHFKGAFTDAREDKAGKFELAKGGTIFLDEIGNIPPELQVKLLSVLQNNEVNRLGGTSSIKIDVRVISATNSAIHELIDKGQFRQDLLYRINTIEVNLPALRNRTDDILPITNYYLNLYKKKYGKASISINSEAEKNLKVYSWPGNVRELQHCIERAVILCDKSTIDVHDLLLKSSENNKPDEPNSNIVDWEQSAIKTAIDQNDGNLSKAAESLGMGRTTLYRKIKKYNL